MLRPLITSLTAASLLALAPVVLRADDAPAPQGPPQGMPQGKAWCDANPEKCADMRKERQERCQANPEQCEKMKQKRAERKEWCDKNPEECAKQREQRRARMEEMKARCAADPAKCEEMKQQMRQRWKDRQEGQGAPAAPAGEQGNNPPRN
jgi:hypothetical protein